MDQLTAMFSYRAASSVNGCFPQLIEQYSCQITTQGLIGDDQVYSSALTPGTGTGIALIVSPAIPRCKQPARLPCQDRSFPKKIALPSWSC